MVGKNPDDRDRRSLKRLVKSNHRKTTVELRAMFNSESRAFPHAQCEGNSMDWDQTGV